MKRSTIGLIGFGLLSLWSLFVVFNGGNPGGALIVGIVGFAISLGDYYANHKP